MNKQKQTFAKILSIGVLILAILPFWNSFQDLLTNFVMRVGFYKSIQNIVVPYQISIVASIFNLLKMPISAGSAYFDFIDKKGVAQAVYLIWNCVGWQTFILFATTLITGFSGNYKLSSKFEALLFGVLGTYLINIFRIFLVIIIYFYFGRVVGLVFHDYFSSILTMVWLVFYWWFSFKFILEEKQTKRPLT